MQAGNKNCYYGLLIEDELVKFTLNVNNNRKFNDQ